MPLRPALASALILLATSVSADDLTWERDIRPILKEHCFHCHGEAGVREGSLDVRLRRLLVAGGDSGAAIVPGDADNSYLLHRLRDGEMPPGDDNDKAVPAEQVERIAGWINQGAITARAEPDSLGDADLITEEERSFWAFQPVQRPDVPDVRNVAQVSNPIDAFLLRKLEAHDLMFSPPADRRTLGRRIWFTLAGIPPEPGDLDRFASDVAPDSLERLIDRLLDSPHYGDRWGRHWLDVAGYADSEGYNDDDTERVWAWKYRDWVIRSLNEDKPWDEFVREQLAGDEMVQPPFAELPPEEIRRLIATGFLRMSPDGTGGAVGDANLARNEVVAETIKIVSTSLLGLTVGCAQCHDHRYDPIPQSDYYRFRAIFEPALDWKNWRAPRSRLVSMYTQANRDRAAEIEGEARKIDAARTAKQTEFINRTVEKELKKLPEAIRKTVRSARDTPAKKRTAEQTALLKQHPSVNVTAGSLYLYDKKAADELKAMTAEATRLRGTKPPEEFVRALTEQPGKVPQTFLFSRGDHEQPKDALEPADLQVLCENPEEAALPVNDESLPTTGRRLAFARRLTHPNHPLFARVIVNRVWMHHFGRGLVNTPGDFGVLGDKPTHPELLDWLASEFTRSGWSLKRLHRLIMTSTAWQQSLRKDRTQDELDPDNRLYGGARLRRMDAEVLRDSVLAVSGVLNDERGGPPVPVMADRVGQFVVGKENLNAGRPGAVIPLGGAEFRKTVYIQSRRSRPLTVLDAFDLPRMTPNCEKRTESTVATQSLMMMNSGLMADLANRFAKRVGTAAGTAADDRIILAWRLAYGRGPAEDELAGARDYLAAQTAHFSKHPVAEKAGGKKKANQRPPEDVALGTLCQMLLSSNEFLYVD